MDPIRKLEAVSLDPDEKDKAERRTGLERRHFSYSAYIPERRTGGKRRKKPNPDKSLKESNTQDNDS